MQMGSKGRDWALLVRAGLRLIICPQSGQPPPLHWGQGGLSCWGRHLILLFLMLLLLISAIPETGSGPNLASLQYDRTHLCLTF